MLKWFKSLFPAKPKVGELWWNYFGAFEVEILKVHDKEVTYYANGCTVSTSIKWFMEGHEPWDSHYDSLH